MKERIIPSQCLLLRGPTPSLLHPLATPPTPPRPPRWTRFSPFMCAVDQSYLTEHVKRLKLTRRDAFKVVAVPNVSSISELFTGVRIRLEWRLEITMMMLTFNGNFFLGIRVLSSCRQNRNRKAATWLAGYQIIEYTVCA